MPGVPDTVRSWITRRSPTRPRALRARRRGAGIAARRPPRVGVVRGSASVPPRQEASPARVSPAARPGHRWPGSRCRQVVADRIALAASCQTTKARGRRVRLARGCVLAVARRWGTLRAWPWDRVVATTAAVASISPTSCRVSRQCEHGISLRAARDAIDRSHSSERRRWRGEPRCDRPAVSRGRVEAAQHVGEAWQDGSANELKGWEHPCALRRAHPKDRPLADAIGDALTRDAEEPHNLIGTIEGSELGVHRRWGRHHRGHPPRDLVESRVGDTATLGAVRALDGHQRPPHAGEEAVDCRFGGRSRGCHDRTLLLRTSHGQVRHASASSSAARRAATTRTG